MVSCSFVSPAMTRGRTVCPCFHFYLHVVLLLCLGLTQFFLLPLCPLSSHPPLSGQCLRYSLLCLSPYKASFIHRLCFSIPPCSLSSTCQWSWRSPHPSSGPTLTRLDVKLKTYILKEVGRIHLKCPRRSLENERHPSKASCISTKAC